MSGSETFTPKLLALDIDGTLLVPMQESGISAEQVTPAVREAINRAVDSGCHVVLASGRSPLSMSHVLEHLELPRKVADPAQDQVPRGARLGRPRPTVGCPWPKRRKNKRLREIQEVLDQLKAKEVAVYLDEVDIHLNPKIGLDWMNRGTQKEVETPGQNVKRYLCGAMDTRTGQVAWVKGESKNSVLFVTMLHKLVEMHPAARKIHVVLDNYKIHDSRFSQAAVAALGGKVVLHFLPPYCPTHNKIERLWQDLHANVTRNHTCRDIAELMRRVSNYLNGRNRRKGNVQRKAA